MSEPTAFAELVRRVRAGNHAAAAELVRKYEPLIRREVRLRLEDQRLNRLFDSTDVCQSVMKSFFVRAAAGQYDLDDPGQLVRLLATMARNKLASAARRQHQAKRDQRRQAAEGAALDLVAEGDPTPSRVVAGRDLLDEVRRRLSGEERELADLRARGTAQARRVQLSRALDRLARDLDIDDGDAE
jgi:hypothetical protein